jgi:hypothetical protein
MNIGKRRRRSEDGCKGWEQKRRSERKMGGRIGEGKGKEDRTEEDRYK